MTGTRSRGAEVFKGTKEAAPRPTSSSTVDTLIGRQTEVQGDVRFAGGLHIDGRVKGKVIATPDKSAVLSVSESGSIEGDVSVPNVVLNGTIIGDVHASERISLNSKARVIGSVYYKLIEMASGSTVNGQLVHEGEAPIQAITHSGGEPADAGAPDLESNTAPKP